MYIYHFSSVFNHKWTLLFKSTFKSFNLFFDIIKTHIFYLIQAVLVVVTFQKLWCLVIYSTYLFGFNHAGFIQNVVNNSVVLFFFMESFPRYGIASAVPCRLGCSLLSSKFAQDRTFIRRISSAIYHTGFWCALQAIYILFTELSSAPILWGMGVRWGGFSLIITIKSSTVGFYPSSFFIRMCYHTFINTFSDFRMLKHIYSIF